MGIAGQPLIGIRDGKQPGWTVIGVEA
jgi:hypothetical protein